MADASYKARKERFVSGLTGGDIGEINAITAIAPVSPVVVINALRHVDRLETGLKPSEALLVDLLIYLLIDFLQDCRSALVCASIP